MKPDCPASGLGTWRPTANRGHVSRWLVIMERPTHIVAAHFLLSPCSSWCSLPTIGGASGTAHPTAWAVQLAPRALSVERGASIRDPRSRSRVRQPASRGDADGD